MLKKSIYCVASGFIRQFQQAIFHTGRQLDSEFVFCDINFLIWYIQQRI